MHRSNINGHRHLSCSVIHRLHNKAMRRGRACEKGSTAHLLCSPPTVGERPLTRSDRSYILRTHTAQREQSGTTPESSPAVASRPAGRFQGLIDVRNREEDTGCRGPRVACAIARAGALDERKALVPVCSVRFAKLPATVPWASQTGEATVRHGKMKLHNRDPETDVNDFDHAEERRLVRYT
eukprot:6183388-Pleurochrysis_carterae.AAC.2